MLPRVVRFNAEDPSAAEAYRDLMIAAGLAALTDPPIEVAERLAQMLDGLLAAADMPRSLSGANANLDLIPTLAEEAAGQWTANFNPRAMSVEDFQALYESAMDSELVSN
jgi:alcohol dehydrogenase